MTDVPAPLSSSDPPDLISAMYWRKNPFLAMMMVPLVITLTDGRFTAIGPDGAEVFDAPASASTCKLGRMGTLKIVINGRRFAIVGRGSLGGSEKQHSDAQRHYVTEFLQRLPHAGSVQHGEAGLVDLLFNESAAAKLGVWRDALIAAGAALG